MFIGSLANPAIGAIVASPQEFCASNLPACVISMVIVVAVFVALALRTVLREWRTMKKESVQRARTRFLLLPSYGPEIESLNDRVADNEMPVSQGN